MQDVQPKMQQIYAKIRETLEGLSGLMHISDSQELKLVVAGVPVVVTHGSES